MRRFTCGSCGFDWDYQATTLNECPRCKNFLKVKDREATHHMHGGSRTPQYHCNVCGTAHNSDSKKGKFHEKHARKK